jgi:hypothetical protein
MIVVTDCVCVCVLICDGEINNFEEHNQTKTNNKKKQNSCFVCVLIVFVSSFKPSLI